MSSVQMLKIERFTKKTFKLFKVENIQGFPIATVGECLVLDLELKTCPAAGDKQSSSTKPSYWLAAVRTLPFFLLTREKSCIDFSKV